MKPSVPHMEASWSVLGFGVTVIQDTNKQPLTIYNDLFATVPKAGHGGVPDAPLEGAFHHKHISAGHKCYAPYDDDVNPPVLHDNWLTDAKCTAHHCEPSLH